MGIHTVSLTWKCFLEFIGIKTQSYSIFEKTAFIDTLVPS